MNYIVMKNQKSKLIDEIAHGNGICVVITNENKIDFNINTYCFIQRNYMQLANNIDMLEFLNQHSSIVIYSNEKKSENIEYIHEILKLIDEDKVVFMFKED